MTAGRRPKPDQSSPTPAPSLAITTASELLRTALLAKLAADLGDPQLARRAARGAQSSPACPPDWSSRTYDDTEQAAADQTRARGRRPPRADAEPAGGRGVTASSGGAAPRTPWAQSPCPRVIHMRTTGELLESGAHLELPPSLR